MNHHVGHFQIAEPENVLDVFRLTNLHLAVLGGDLDESFDFGVGEDFQLRAFPDAEHAQQRTRGRVEQPIERIEKKERYVERIGDPLRHRNRLADRQRFRHLLAHHDVQRGEHEKADQERREVQRRFRHPERDQDRRQQRGDGWLANPAQAQRRHRDAELAARQIGLDVAHHLLQETGGEAVVLGHRIDAKALALYQRKFRRHVKRVGSEQQNSD
jgi:hypothetical protein